MRFRRRLGIHQGDYLEFNTTAPETVIRPVREKENPFDRWRGVAEGAFPGGLKEIRVGNSSRAFSEVRDYVEMKVRTLLTRRKRRRKSSVGWRRWSNEYLYDVLGLENPAPART